MAGGWGPEVLDEASRDRVWQGVWELWRQRLLGEGLDSHRTVGAVLSSWEAWRGGAGVPLTFRVTQVLTGHGCFGEYLCRIKRERDAKCHHCEEGRDTAQHTLEFCPAWDGERRVLTRIVGEDVSPAGVIRALLGGPEKWEAVTSFCEQVMLQKEVAERDRERDSHPSRMGGRRGRRFRRAVFPGPLSPPA